ncbi:MAG: type II toxin-antitoxin system HicB family antitoxin, partial [Lysobacterales bacterium]
MNAIRRPAGLEQATHYPIFIEPGNEARAWGVVVPDLPGCFSTGDTLDEAIIAAEQAAAAWIDVALDAGMPIPPSSPAANWAGQFPGWLLGVVNIEP